MIHQTAIIDPKAELGNDVSVGPFTCIDADVKVGDGCVIGPHATILPYTTVGTRCTVHSGAILGDLPQDLGYKESVSYVEIGEECTIREGVTVHRGTGEGTVTRVGSNCLLMAFSHVAHNVQMGNSVILCNGGLLAGYAEIDDGAFISGNGGVHQFCKVGRLAMLGANSIATKDVPPYCIVRSCALNAIAGLNVVAMRRAGMDKEDRQAVQRAFRILYKSGFNVSDAKKRLEEEFPDGPASEFASFIERSERGICGFGV